VRSVRHTTILCSAALWLTFAVIGCTQSQPVHYLGDAQLGYYEDTVTKIAYPDVHVETNQDAVAGFGPHRLRDRKQDEIWNLSLQQAIHLALQNNEIIRTSGSFRSPFNTLLTNPNGSSSVFDPAIRETGFLFGSRGVEAALADFDANLTTTMTWGRNETLLNNPLFGQTAGSTQFEETGNFRAELEKSFVNGSTISVNHNINYSSTNLPSLLFPSSYTGSLGFDYRIPLLAGYGTKFTRTAGPIGQNLRGVSGFDQGVLIARINSDISVADFELSVRNMLKDVEDLYWDLYLAYRVYDSEVISRDSALRTWREVKARAEQGLEGGGRADEAQARDNYFEVRVRTENALADIYASETALRRLIGLPVNDGRIIRPSDEPLIAEFQEDWHVALAEALTRRIELRRQKWTIKSLELQLSASKSTLKPRLDFTAGYQLNALGDKLFADDDDDGVTAEGFNGFYNTLTQGNQTGWNLGFEFLLPFGFRRAHSAVRNFELRLAKARAGLQAQELEISHELSAAFQDVDRWYTMAETNFNRRRAAEERVKAFETQYELGQANLDLLLRAQVSRAQAEIAYYQSLVEYNKSLTDIHYRKGTLIERDHIQMSEGLWQPGAYEEALKRAWARSHAFDAEKYLYNEPRPFSSDEVIGTVDMFMPPNQSAHQPLPAAPMPEEFEPAPDPEAESKPPKPKSTQINKVHLESDEANQLVLPAIKEFVPPPPAP